MTLVSIKNGLDISNQPQSSNKVAKRFRASKIGSWGCRV
jgi:hypothetical protein